MRYISIEKVESIFDSLIEKDINKYSISNTSKEIVDVIYDMNDEELFNFFIYDCYEIFIPLWYMCNEDYQSLIQNDIMTRLSKYMKTNSALTVNENYDAVGQLVRYFNDNIAALSRHPFRILEDKFNNKIQLVELFRKTLGEAGFSSFYNNDELVTYHNEDIIYDTLKDISDINVVLNKLSTVKGLNKLRALIYLLFMNKEQTVKQIILYNINNFKIDREAEMNRQIIPIRESSIGLLLAEAIYLNSTGDNNIIDESLITEASEAFGIYDDNEIYVSESISEELYSKVLESEEVASNFAFSLNHKFISIKEHLKGIIHSVDRDDNKMIYKLLNEAGEITGLIAMLNSGEFKYYNDNIVKESKYPSEISEAVSVCRTYYTIDEGVVGDTMKKVGRTVRTVNKKVSDSIDKVVNALVKEIKSIFVGDTREEIITDALPKMSRLLKMAIPNLLIIGVNPVVGVISAATTYALHSKAKTKERNKILIELKNELELVTEKIEDAKSKGDNKQKYALIRIRQQLDRDIERIRFKYARDI